MRKIYYSKGLKIDFIDGKSSIENSLYEIKRDITLFDQIIYPDLRLRLSYFAKGYNARLSDEVRIQLEEFEQLMDNNIVRDFTLSKNEYLIDRAVGRMSEQQKELFELGMSMSWTMNDQIKILVDAIRKEPNGLNSNIYKMAFWNMQYLQDISASMAITEVLKCNEQLDIISSLEPQHINPPVPLVSKNSVYKFLLYDLPLPSDATPWQDVLDYKAQNNNTRRLARLRNWMNKVLKEQYNDNELIDEYEALYMDFEDSINRQKIKTKRTLLKILLVGIPDLAEDFIKLRFKNIGDKIYKGLFEASSETIALADAEASAPGRELAYMFFSKEKFQQK